MSRLLLRPGEFRLALAALVLISHLSAFSTGRLGVILFFLLSGYWISSLWERQAAEHGNKAIFFVNRFLRIYPLYLVAITLAALLLARQISLVNIIIAGVASTPGTRPLGVEWSLDVEVQFYLLLPLIATWKTPLWVAIPATVVGWIAWVYTGFTNVFMYLPAFIAGIICYRLRGRPILLKWTTSAALFVSATGLLALTAFGRSMLNTKIPDLMNEDIFAMLWGAPLTFYISHSLRLKSTPIDRHLGNLSFPVYLVQEPIIQLLRIYGYPNKVLAVATIAIVASLLYFTLDCKIESWRYAFLDRLTKRLSSRDVALRPTEAID